jgi:predicted glycoside hydrolase/deacetylase ChbG (UPF0249 family)
MKKIIVQGDDFGYTEESNAGIGYAYEYGILTETTVMVNCLDMKKKSEYQNFIKNLENKSGLKKPKLGIGVHLNVTYGKPLSFGWPSPDFTRPHKGSGKPEEWMGSAWKKYFAQFSPQQVESEYRKQIELALEVFNEIDHLDSHHFSSSYEPLKTVYEKLAKEYGLAVRADGVLSEKPVYGGDYIVDREASKRLKVKGIKTADRYVLKLFFNEKDPIGSFLTEMDKVKDGETVEVMFHPGKGKKADSWRKIDLAILTDKKVMSYFNANKVKLIAYGDL